MGLEDSNFELVTNKIEREEETVTKLEDRILAHCLLLPYVLLNKTFNKQFAVVYDDWDVGCLRVPKMTPCNRGLRV